MALAQERVCSGTHTGAQRLWAAHPADWHAPDTRRQRLTRGNYFLVGKNNAWIMTAPENFAGAAELLHDADGWSGTAGKLASLKCLGPRKTGLIKV